MSKGAGPDLDEQLMARTNRALGSVAYIASQRLRVDRARSGEARKRIDPVHLSSIGVWVVMSHAGVERALRDARLTKDESKANPALLAVGPSSRSSETSAPVGARPSFVGTFAQLLTRLRDKGTHSHLRGLVARAFTPRRVEQIARNVQRLIDEILDDASGRGHMDVIQTLAPLPTRVICEVVGIPEGDEAFVIKHAPALSTSLDFAPLATIDAVERADRATLELVDYLTTLVSARRRNPAGDVLSALIRNQSPGHTLEDDELVAVALHLLFAGRETLGNFLGNALVSLIQNRSELERLRADSSIERSAIEELLRYDSPAQMTVRVALEDLDIDGRLIEKGRVVALVIGAANHDPLVFTNPDQLDLGRTPNPHLAFGGGTHFCVGAPLARLEGRVILPAIIRRFPDMRVERATRLASFTPRGFAELQVAWSN